MTILRQQYCINTYSSNAVNIMRYCRLKMAISFVSQFNRFASILTGDQVLNTNVSKRNQISVLQKKLSKYVPF